MKKIYITMFAVAASWAMLTLSACNVVCKQGSGKMITQKRVVSGFDKIEVSGAYQVVIKQDSVESLTVTADDNLMQFINSDVNDHELRIKSHANMCGSGKFVLTISLRDLAGIHTSGAVDVSSNGKITTKDVDLELTGATKVTLDLNANTVNTHGTGLTELNLTGQAATHNVELSGAGHINALDFVVAKYELQTSGASHCKINVLTQLDVNSTGASEVEYRGNPTTINNNKTGASSLKKIN